MISIFVLLFINLCTAQHLQADAATNWWHHTPKHPSNLTLKYTANSSEDNQQLFKQIKTTATSKKILIVVMAFIAIIVMVVIASYSNEIRLYLMKNLLKRDYIRVPFRARGQVHDPVDMKWRSLTSHVKCCAEVTCPRCRRNRV